MRLAARSTTSRSAGTSSAAIVDHRRAASRSSAAAARSASRPRRSAALRRRRSRASSRTRTSSPTRSSFGARLRSRVPQYGHSVTYGLTSEPQLLQTTDSSVIAHSSENMPTAPVAQGCVCSRDLRRRGARRSSPSRRRSASWRWAPVPLSSRSSTPSSSGRQPSSSAFVGQQLDQLARPSPAPAPACRRGSRSACRRCRGARRGSCCRR